VLLSVWCVLYLFLQRVLCDGIVIVMFSFLLMSKIMSEFWVFTMDVIVIFGSIFKII